MKAAIATRIRAVIDWVRRFATRIRAVIDWVRRFAVPILGVLVLALAVAGGVQTLRADNADRAAQRDTTRIQHCLRDFADGVAAAITARASAADAAQDAQDAFFSLLLSIPNTEAGRQAATQAFADYVKLRKDAREKRKTHPYPDPPREVCPE